MPDWNDVLEEISTSNRKDALDFIRRKYLKQLHEMTGRNVIAYYSGWLQKPGINTVSINDDDKNGLMAVIHGLDRSKGLDLILHTPGGDIAATESIVDYLKKMFDGDIRAIVPQLAMSAGTMICCSCNEIIMGKQSSLGPIDPQFSGISTHGVLEEFETAIKEITKDPNTIPLWQVIVGKYHPTFMGDCKKAIDLSSELTKNWLLDGMLKDEEYAVKIAGSIVDELNNHENTKIHSRHISIEECKNIGLKVKYLEEEQDLQDIVLTIHHAYMHTFSQSTSVKIIENHDEKAMVQHHLQNES